MKNTYVPPGLGEMTQITMTYRSNDKEYVMEFEPAFVDMGYETRMESVNSLTSDFPIRQYNAGSTMTINVHNPTTKLTEREIPKMKLKHTMTADFNGAPTTEEITLFSSQLPANATWKVETRNSFGRPAFTFVASWDVEAKKPEPEIEDDEDYPDDYDIY